MASVLVSSGYRSPPAQAPTILRSAATVAVGRTPPTLVQYAETSWSTLTSNQSTTTNISWQAGDWIIVIGGTETNGTGINTPTATGLTFSPGSPLAVASTCWGNTWTANPGSSGGPVAVNATTGTAVVWGIGVWVFRGSDGPGTRATDSTTTKTVSLARSNANSAVVEGLFDFSAASVASHVWTPTGQTERQAQAVGTNYSVFVANWGDQGGAGTTSYGITGTASTGAHTKLALEILGTGTAGASGSAPVVTNPPGRVRSAPTVLTLSSRADPVVVNDAMAPPTVVNASRLTLPGSVLMLGSQAVSPDFQQPPDVITPLLPTRPPGVALVLNPVASSSDFQQPPGVVTPLLPTRPPGAVVVVTSRADSVDVQPAPWVIGSGRVLPVAGSVSLGGSVAPSPDVQASVLVIGASVRLTVLGASQTLGSRSDPPASTDTPSIALVVVGARGPKLAATTALLASRELSPDAQPVAVITGAVSRPAPSGSIQILVTRADPPVITDTPWPVLAITAGRWPKLAGSATLLVSQAQSSDAQPQSLIMGVAVHAPIVGSAQTLASRADPAVSTDAQPAVLVTGIRPMRLYGSVVTLASQTQSPDAQPVGILVSGVRALPSAGLTVITWSSSAATDSQPRPTVVTPARLPRSGLAVVTYSVSTVVSPSILQPEPLITLAGILAPRRGHVVLLRSGMTIVLAPSITTDTVTTESGQSEAPGISGSSANVLIIISTEVDGVGGGIGLAG